MKCDFCEEKMKKETGTVICPKCLAEIESRDEQLSAVQNELLQLKLAWLEDLERWKNDEELIVARATRAEAIVLDGGRAAEMQARDEQLSAARRELDQASKLFVNLQENAISVLRERNALRAENARLRDALSAAIIEDDGEVFYRTANGIKQDVPERIAHKIRAALEATQRKAEK